MFIYDDIAYALYYYGKVIEEILRSTVKISLVAKLDILRTGTISKFCQHGVKKIIDQLRTSAASIRRVYFWLQQVDFGMSELRSSDIPINFGYFVFEETRVLFTVLVLWNQF